MKEQLIRRLSRLEDIAKGTKLKRLFHSPGHYIKGQFFNHVIYKNTKKGKLAIAKTFFDVDMKLLLPAGMDIYLLGGKTHDSEIRLTRFMLEHLKEGDTVLDVGTHFGFYSLLASKLVGDSGRIIGIEASEAMFQIYKSNIATAKNIKPFHLAAAEENSEVSFFEFPVLYSEYNTLSPDQFDGAEWIKKNPPKEIKVQGKRLEDVLRSEIAVPDFIKIDVEGAEDKAIKGLIQTLKESSPLVALEYLADERENQAHRNAETQLKQLAYKAHLIAPSGQLIPIENVSHSMRASKIESDNIIFKKN